MTDQRRALRLAPLCSLLLLTVLGCVAPPLPSLGPERLTTNLDADEQALWKESRELQHKIERSGLLFYDAGIDAYLARVLDRVTPAELRAAGVTPRVEVISDVNIGGYSFANGVIYIHTALLSHMTDETQLATLLSRELSHVLYRNALQAKRVERVLADGLAWIGVGSSLVEGGGNAKLLVQAASVTTAAGFDHTVETRADEKGLALLDRAGYAVGGTPALYEMTLAYLAQVHSQGVWGWAPFTAPPQVTARIVGMKNLVSTQYANQQETKAPLLDAAAFRRTIHPATLRQTELEMAAGLFVSAEETARLATSSRSNDPEAWILMGRALFGQRSKPIPGRAVPSIKKVRAAFNEALRVDPRHAEANRELALTYYRPVASRRTEEDGRQALQLFRRYLALAPDAGDREYVRGYIAELEGMQQ